VEDALNAFELGPLGYDHKFIVNGRGGQCKICWQANEMHLAHNMNRLAQGEDYFEVV
jgi:hypothetical protein